MVSIRGFDTASPTQPKSLVSIRLRLLNPAPQPKSLGLRKSRCNIGAAQTARHAQESITRRILQRINSQHITTERLQAALQDVVTEYTRFELPFLWGEGKTAIVDGTYVELIENNLLGERHIRHGGYGGIAYHHISDTYIALFSHFIACGVWLARAIARARRCIYLMG